jgi:hypothetical protein
VRRCNQSPTLASYTCFTQDSNTIDADPPLTNASPWLAPLLHPPIHPPRGLAMNFIVPVYFLWGLVAESFLVGLASVYIGVPISMAIAKKIKAVRKEMLKTRDERVRVTTEILKSMGTVRCLGWDQIAEGWVDERRNNELRTKFKALSLNMCNVVRMRVGGWRPCVMVEDASRAENGRFDHLLTLSSPRSIISSLYHLLTLLLASPFSLPHSSCSTPWVPSAQSRPSATTSLPSMES